MKKVVLVMFVILFNLCLTSCESNDDEFFEEMNQIEFSINDGEDELLPPRRP